MNASNYPDFAVVMHTVTLLYKTSDLQKWPNSVSSSNMFIYLSIHDKHGLINCSMIDLLHVENIWPMYSMIHHNAPLVKYFDSFQQIGEYFPPSYIASDR